MEHERVVRRSPNAMKANEEFLKGYNANLEAVRGIALNILVWGPNLEDGSPESQKRKDLAIALLEDGHNAMFSEDLQTSGLPIDGAEYLQAIEADAIVVMYIPTGAIQAVH